MADVDTEFEVGGPGAGSNVTELFPKYITDDLAKSGCHKDQMRVRALGQAERHATGSPMSVDGYVIPYFSIDGKPIPFYRVRLFDWDPKYRQLTEQSNHIYFPRGFWELAQTAKYILFTEGEKKAQCAVNHGFATCAVGGVDSWRNRTLSMPKDIQLSKSKDGRIVAKLPAGTETNDTFDTVAVGLVELIALIIRRNIPLIITYDSDTRTGLSTQVQAAAAILGYELRFRGIPANNIRQLVLRPSSGYSGERLALDDFLMSGFMGPAKLEEAIAVNLAQASTFPKHPNPKDYVNKKLRRAKLSREQLQGLATAVLSDLDAKGSRLYAPDEDELYYFSKENHRLTKVHWRLTEEFSKSTFGVHLYQHYNLSIADTRLMTWIGTQYSGEQPIADVKPEKVITLREDTLYYQATGGKMLKVSADAIDVLDNGSDDILFQSNAVEPLDMEKLTTHIHKIGSLKGSAPFPNYWYDVLKETRIVEDSENRRRFLLSLLYAISPWFYRWRGTQLPVEMTIGEGGSGKSSLYLLRLSILHGKPILRNAPKDLRDWSASISETGGLHVTDNVHMSDKSLKQELSDELCRLVTEPSPHIERRKLYSDKDLIRIPVQTVFAVTAIHQPFTNADIIQRSIITHLDKGTEEVEFDMEWWERQLERFGGREGWIAQQVIFQQRLFRLIKHKWKAHYRAKFRLINLEQLLMLAAEVYGEDGSWIPAHLEGDRNEVIEDSDWTLQGLKAFSEAARKKFGDDNWNARFTSKDIAEWASEQEAYKGCHMLINSRMLGKYMVTNTNMLATIAGITKKGTKANAAAYYCHIPTAQPKTN